MSFNLDAYCARIGYSGLRVPTSETLCALHRLHPQAIAYENISPLLGLPVLLDESAISNKVLRDGRGGYCFEQNLLLAAALSAFQFKWRLLTGWPRWGVPAETPRPRIHILLLVEADGEEWVCDVGFGGNTLTAPLLARSRDEQQTPHESARLFAKDATLMVQVKIGGEWRDLVEFDLGRQTFAELEMANWFTSTHPKSRFRNELFVARPDDGIRYVMLDNALATHRLDAGSERRTLANCAEMRDALTDLMRINLPKDPALDSMLSRIADKAP